MTYNSNDILDLLYKTTLGKYELFNEEVAEGIWYELDEQPNNIFETYHVGATKFVLIPEHGDFIIKIPFNSNIIRDEDGEEVDTIEFYRANGNFNDWDYCAVESERYNIAQGYGFERYFAPTIYIGQIRDWPIYIQPKCFVLNEAKNCSNESRAKAKEITYNSCFNYLKIDYDWLGYIVENNGEDEAEALVRFLYQNNWDDFHHSNVGFYQGQPVIFDYSDYNE